MAADLITQLTAALDWWREAGVDSAFADAPQQWISAPGEETLTTTDPANVPPVIKPPPAASPPRPTIGGNRADWPQALGEFAAWWLAEPSLGLGQLHGRVPPRGAAEAELMVLVAQPEAGDSDTLLSGPQGKLLTAMVSAMGLAEAQVYVASALPRHTPMADWADLAAEGLGEVLRHHVALVRPRRAIAFGRHIMTVLGADGLVLPLPAHGSAQIIPDSPIVSHNIASVPLLVARDLGSLLERPIAKGAFWQQWLEWHAGQWA